MFLDIFQKLADKYNKPKLFNSATNFLPILSPSSQSCYSLIDNSQLGACLRQQWFDKNNYLKTNTFIAPHVKMSAYIGDKWEEWVLNDLKELGIYADSQIPVTVPKYFVKGFIDGAIYNPLDSNKVELLEIKTYDGGNFFNSKNIYGTKSDRPTPKITHLLQAFKYLIILKDKVEAINLLYVDRSCSGWYKNKQFRITLLEFENDFYPQIEFLWEGCLTSYVDRSISEKAIKDTDRKLLDYIINGQIPNKDFKPIYTEEEVELNFSKGLIYKTNYDKYKKDPSSVRLGDYQCNLCPFSNGTCEKYG